MEPVRMQFGEEEQHRRNLLSRDAWSRFAAHRVRVTSEILAAIERARTSAPTNRSTMSPAGGHDKLRVLIVGAGNCNDLELPLLLEAVDELHLLDLDRQSLAMGVARQESATHPRLKIHGGIDVAGIFPHIDPTRPLPLGDHASQQRLIELAESYDPLRSADVVSATIVKGSGKKGPRLSSPDSPSSPDSSSPDSSSRDSRPESPELESIEDPATPSSRPSSQSRQPEGSQPPFDVVASVCLLTQILEPILASVTPQQPLHLPLLQAVRLRHLQLLVRWLRPAGAGLLITDIVSNATCPGLENVSATDLPSVLHHLVTERNFFTGLNPRVIEQLFLTGPELSGRLANVEALTPWLWDFGPRVYAVCGWSFEAPLPGK